MTQKNLLTISPSNYNFIFSEYHLPRGKKLPFIDSNKNVNKIKKLKENENLIALKKSLKNRFSDINLNSNDYSHKYINKYLGLSSTCKNLLSFKNRAIRNNIQQASNTLSFNYLDIDKGNININWLLKDKDVNQKINNENSKHKKSTDRLVYVNESTNTDKPDNILNNINNISLNFLSNLAEIEKLAYIIYRYLKFCKNLTNIDIDKIIEEFTSNDYNNNDANSELLRYIINKIINNSKISVNIFDEEKINSIKVLLIKEIKKIKELVLYNSIYDKDITINKINEESDNISINDKNNNTDEIKICDFKSEVNLKNIKINEIGISTNIKPVNIKSSKLEPYAEDCDYKNDNNNFKSEKLDQNKNDLDEYEFTISSKSKINSNIINDIIKSQKKRIIIKKPMNLHGKIRNVNSLKNLKIDELFKTEQLHNKPLDFLNKKYNNSKDNRNVLNNNDNLSGFKDDIRFQSLDYLVNERNRIPLNSTSNNQKNKTLEEENYFNLKQKYVTKDYTNLKSNFSNNIRNIKMQNGFYKIPLLNNANSKEKYKKDKIEKSPRFALYYKQFISNIANNIIEKAKAKDKEKQDTIKDNKCEDYYAIVEENKNAAFNKYSQKFIEDFMHKQKKNDAGVLYCPKSSTRYFQCNQNIKTNELYCKKDIGLIQYNKKENLNKKVIIYTKYPSSEKPMTKKAIQKFKI